MQLVAPATEFGDNIFGQEFRIAAGDIHIYIGNPHKAIQHRFKFSQKLYFVKQNIVHLIINDLSLDMWVENFGITEPFGFKGIEGNFDDMVCIYTVLPQVLLEESKQQIGLSAAAHAGNNFDQSIMLFCYQFIEVIVTLDLQFNHSY